MKTHRTVESFRIDAIKEVQLPSSIEGLPFDAAALQKLLVDCPAILTDPQAVQDSLPFTIDSNEVTDTFHLHQPSDAHKRSFEVISPEPHQMWMDEYGNRYGALTLKGNNFSNPSIVEHPTASEGFIAYGLQESSIIERVVRASEALRSRNISTEYTIGVAEPKQYPWPLLGAEADAYEMVSLKEYKRRIVDNYWQDLPEVQRTPQVLAELYSKFQDMTFYVSLRATDTAYRLYDMSDLASRRRVFSCINDQGYLPPDTTPLDASRPEDLDRYVEQVFSPNAGRNYARLHVGMSHGFAHGYNMSALGSIVDLDSVRGALLGLDDEPVTNHDRAKDLRDAISAINSFGGSSPLHTAISKASLEFVDSYINESMIQHGSPLSAVHYLNDVFTTLAENMQQTRSGFQYANPNELFQYVNARLVAVLGELTSDEELNASRDQVRQCLQAVMHDSAMDEVIEGQFRADVDSYAQELIEEYVNEITTAVINGEQYDVYADFSRSFAVSSSYISTMMVDKTVAMYAAELGQRLSDVVASQQNNDTYASLVSQAVYRSILKEYDAELKLFAKMKLLQVLPLLQEALTHQAEFAISTPLLGSKSPLAYVGLNDSHLWICTEEVEIADVLPYVDDDLVIDAFPMHGAIPRTIVLPVNAPERIDEIISDTYLDGWAHSYDDDQYVMNITYADDPSYVLIRETMQGGKERMRLLLAAETVQLLRDGVITISQLAPAYRQPELF